MQNELRYSPIQSLHAVVMEDFSTAAHLLLSLPLCSRRSLPLVGGVAGPRQAKSGIGVPAPLRVLPDAHDCELPGAELHRRPGRSAL